ncbi:MAG: hypothetical protein ACRCXZ_06750 [Patescibacteria group bacterium]
MKIAVIKIGTDSIVKSNGNLNLKVIDGVIDSVIELRKLGIYSILVCSGAVAIGKKQHKHIVPSDLNRDRIYASIGQPILISKLQKRVQKNKLTLSQVLLTSKDFEDNERKSILIHTFYEKLQSSILPVVNENDLLSNEELDCVPIFNDNDSLAVNVAILTSSKWLFLLSAGIDGLYIDYKDFSKGVHQQVFEIESIFDSISTTKSESGRGGMQAKIKAIELATSKNITTFLINGFHPINISKAVKKDFDFLGTQFNPK